MIWLINIIGFVCWVCLAPAFMVKDDERDLLHEVPRRQGLRKAISFLGMLPIVGHLFGMHGWVFALIFLFVCNAVAFSMRLLTDLLPIWVTACIALIAIVVSGYSYIWYLGVKMGHLV